jgi:hypothetical protein
MKAMFGSITKAGKWKWELDLAAHRLGKQYVPEVEEERDGQRFEENGEMPQMNDELDNEMGQQGGGHDETQFEVSRSVALEIDS